MDLSSHTALITGGSRGIGKAIAGELAARGSNLIFVARSSDDLSSARREIQNNYDVSVATYTADLSKSTQLHEMYESVSDTSSQVNILVNNAGVGVHGRLVDTDMDKEVAMLRLNTEAVLRLTKLFLPQMVDRGSGYILNVASTAAFQPGPLMANYFATKSYVLSLTVALAQELQGSDVSATALCPGPTDTSFPKRAHASNARTFDRAGPIRPVAKKGVEGMLAGKRVVTPGLLNKIGAYLARIVPISIAAKVAEYANSPAD